MDTPQTSRGMHAAEAGRAGARAIDWAAIRAWVENAANSAGDSETAQTRVEAVLRERAKKLAAPLPHYAELKKTGAELMQAVAVRLGGQDFAVDAMALREVMECPRVTPLPGLPPVLRGLANVRSRIVPAYDIRALLNLPPRAKDAEREKLVLLSFEGAEFGLLVDAVLGARTIASEQLRREVSGLMARFIQGVTGDGLILLDLPSLVAAFLSEEGEA